MAKLKPEIKSDLKLLALVAICVAFGWCLNEAAPKQINVAPMEVNNG